MTLEQMLNKVDRLFGVTANNEPELHPYLYTLGRFPYGWVFNVVSSWGKWSDAGYKSEFGAYAEPRYAVQAFLNYVQLNNIDVQKLM